MGDENANYDGAEDKNENGDKHVRDYTEAQKKDSNLDGPGIDFDQNEAAVGNDGKKKNSNGYGNELYNGEEIFLKYRNIKIFKAKFEATPQAESTVHGRKINENEIRCFITKVMQKALEWEGFDIDVHCVDATILWSKRDAEKIGKFQQWKY